MTGPADKAALIRHALRGVIDPEIGRSVVDVGLIYGIHVKRNKSRAIQCSIYFFNFFFLNLISKPDRSPFALHKIKMFART